MVLPLTKRTTLNIAFLFISQYLSWLYFSVIYPEGNSLSLSPFFSFIHVFIEWCAVALIYNLFWGKNRLKNTICHLFAFQVLLIQTIQFLSLYNSQDYINAIALSHAGLVGLLITGKVLGLFAASFFVPIFILYFITRRTQKISSLSFKKHFTLIGVNLLLLGLIITAKNNALIFKLERFSYPANRDSMVATFWKELGKYGKITKSEEPNITLSDEEYHLLEEHGIFINKEAEFPLIKDFIYQKDLPFKYKDQAENHEKVNMIVIFTESLNARMLESYNPDRTGLTPNIASFAKSSLQVENYLNHAFPTIVGLRGQLCSIFPTLDNSIWNKGRSRAKTAQNKCMPQILKQNKYETVYLGYSHPNETFFNDQMKEFGFGQRYFYDDLLRNFYPEKPVPERGHYGNSDEQMFQSLIGFLEQHNPDKKFFLAMSTIETHPGMDVLNPEKLQAQFNNPVLRIVHNFDEQFGKFWNYFKQSKYKDNTIIVLTADHAHVPNMDYMKVAGKNYGRDSYFDPITLIIHDPTRIMPEKFITNGTSIDFAPTMLQLLNIPNERNHFLGLSLFSDRPEKKGGLGIVTKSRFMICKAPDEDHKSSFEIKNLSLEKCAHLKEPMAKEACALYRGVRFTQSLSQQDKLYR